MVKSASIVITVGVPAVPGSITNVTVNGNPVPNGGSYSVPLGTVITGKGTLLDTHGAPLAGWTVIAVFATTGRTILSATTDASGVFTFSMTASAKGTFTVDLEPQGYASIKYAITAIVT